ncbi:LAME_0G17612g1_1 [Lachancea meyersii CBS 8951]|uniref:LAME_0G17612g1_1 n=1 Tax=Lachancea meyersii CBS 8951 TaxID=1266667 RepID=A0A1G4KBH9_9SACH|nr:LAME_0G17612g1_1 [Lachancea meyersii CBS 8951]
MPIVEVSVSKLKSLFDIDGSVAVTTPLGNTLLEIQGELEFPTVPPVNDVDNKFSIYNNKNIVRFGLLQVEPGSKKATMLVGEKQRLLGSVVKLDSPLGLLKFDHSTGTVDLQDVIRYKIIFKDRPLPIM